tara:strand:+ start:154 stop:261 length:108 start_codon:yes stop_codon:yes gene_type:complete
MMDENIDGSTLHAGGQLSLGLKPEPEPAAVNPFNL